jgi:flap endonuclease-1
MRFSREKVVDFMCGEHGFSEERIGKFADRLSEAKKKAGQKGISKWF